MQQHQVERAFYRILENGDETAIAHGIGKSIAYVSQLYSPDSERQSTLYRAIEELRAWRKESRERGAQALALFVELVERDLPVEILSVQAEILKLKKEGDDLETQAMSGARLEVLKDEVVDIQIQAGQTLRAILRKSIEAKTARNGK